MEEGSFLSSTIATLETLEEKGRITTFDNFTGYLITRLVNGILEARPGSIRVKVEHFNFTFALTDDLATCLVDGIDLFDENLESHPSEGVTP